MDSALSPREIQARIRSGASVEDVAAEAGVSMDQVEPFAVPVLAELDHVVEVAMGCPVRRHGDPGSRRGLRSIVAQVCRAHDMDADDITWHCWRHQDRSWALVAGWEGEPGPGQGQATFRFDLRSRYSTPQDVGARWLVDDRVPLTDPQDQDKDPDKEPTIDLHDDLAIVRAVSDRARPSRRRPAAPPSTDDHAAGAGETPHVPGMTSTDGVYDFVPESESQMDMLYEMLAGFQEDSVNIYEGFSEPIATPAPPPSPAKEQPDKEQPDKEQPAEDRHGPVGGADSPEEQVPEDESPEERSARHQQPGSPESPQRSLVADPKPGGRRKRRGRGGKRASIPSWDEIMFGGPDPKSED